MKKEIFVFLGVVILVVAIFVIAGFASAERGENQNNNKKMKKEIIFKDSAGNFRKVKIEREERNGETRQKIRFEKGVFEAKTRLQIEVEGDEVRVKLSDGRMKRVRFMPDQIAAKAIEKLGSDALALELVEDKGRLVYEVRTEKEGRFLGLFKTKVKIKGIFDPETGVLIGKKKSFWAFLVAGEDSIQVGSKVTICHIPRGDPDNAHTITIGGPAVAKHLANHGDTLGACVGGNGNGDGNDTMENLTLEIISPIDNFNYTNDTILVNISSNGDFVSFTINNGTEEVYTSPIFRIFLEGENVLAAFANNSEGEELTASVMFNVTLSDGNQTDDNQGNQTGGTVQ